MKNRFRSQSVRVRQGMTIVEVLIAAGVMLLLIALLAPAVTGQRVNSRRLQCLNNLKNIALAAQNFSGLNNGSLPTLYSLQEVDGVPDTPVNWPVALLGYLDREDLATAPLTYAADQSVLTLSLAMFTCADDPGKRGQRSGLSYVANAGYGNFPPDSLIGPRCLSDGANARTAAHTGLDVNWGNFGVGSVKAQEIAYETGVFQIPDQTDLAMRMSLDWISNRDGLGQTLMFSENLHAHNWGLSTTPEIDKRLNFPAEHNLRFTILETAFVMNAKPGDVAGAGGGQLTLTSNCGSTDSSALGCGGAPMITQLTYCKANYFKDGGTMLKSPVPSSNHPGVVNVVYCDGHGGTLGDAVDGSVYARVITSGGVKHGQPALGNCSY